MMSMSMRKIMTQVPLPARSTVVHGRGNATLAITTIHHYPNETGSATMEKHCHRRGLSSFNETQSSSSTSTTTRNPPPAPRPKSPYPDNMPRWKQYMHNGTPELVLSVGIFVWLAVDWWVIQPWQDQREELRVRQDLSARLQKPERQNDEEKGYGEYYESIQKTRDEWKQEWLSSSSSSAATAKPHLYKAKILRILPNFDGPLSLTQSGGGGSSNVHVGDVVEVLREKVGPAEAYCLCRTIIPTTSTTNNKNKADDTAATATKDKVVIGWCPTHTLQKL